MTWLIVDDIDGASIGQRAIVDSEGYTVCAPSPMGAANARLIVASHDLLDACRECLALLTEPDADPWQADRVEARLRQAIDRATGGAA